jgi:hypothetical protein
MHAPLSGLVSADVVSAERGIVSAVVNRLTPNRRLLFVYKLVCSLTSDQVTRHHRIRVIPGSDHVCRTSLSEA